MFLSLSFSLLSPLSVKINKILKKKKEIFIFCNNMDGPRKHYAKGISQSEKDQYHMISLLCGI